MAMIRLRGLCEDRLRVHIRRPDLEAWICLSRCPGNEADDAVLKTQGRAKVSLFIMKFVFKMEPRDAATYI